MAYISKKEQDLLVWVENFMFDILQNRQDVFVDLEGFGKVYNKYLELWVLNEKLLKDRELNNLKSKENMRNFRTNSKTSKKAKKKAREYMREYNKRDYVIEKKLKKKGGE